MHHTSFSALLHFFTLKRCLILLLILYIMALTLPYVAHKKVSEDFIETFSKRTFSADSVGKERAAYINDNSNALLYRLSMIDKAQESIIMSTFDFNQDDAGTDIMAALFHAAERGVKVRVIIDGFSGIMDVQRNDWFEILTSHENIEVKIYNPINFLKPWDMQARLHDKYLIIDQSMYLLGGRNTMNLFLGDYSSSKNIDRELFVLETQPDPNASIHQLTDYFKHVWESSDSHSFLCKNKKEKHLNIETSLRERYKQLTQQYPTAYQDWDWESLTFETNKISLLSNPIGSNNKEPWMWYAISSLMDHADKVTIYTPYIICGSEMYRDIFRLTQNGTDIEIITNDVASGANPWGCTDYLNQKKRIYKTGVKVYEYIGEHSCHTKAFLLDERISILGSYNLDMRSTYQDTELMLVVDSPHLNKIMRQEAEQDKISSKTMQADGTYQYGENYVPIQIGVLKQIFYAVLRVLIIPIRRFL